MSENTDQTPNHFTIPNLLTMARIVLIPVLIIIFYLPYHWSYLAASAMFLLAGLTDLLDGYLARKWDQTSRLGAFLDPVADKLIVASTLIMLVERHASAWLAIPAIVIISREIAVSALREWMAEVGARATVAVSNMGKIKTTLQIIAIAGLLAIEPTFNPDGSLAMNWLLGGVYIMLYGATLLTLWSMCIYLKAAWPHLSSSDRK